MESVKTIRGGKLIMFTVKLATGETFNATAADLNRYRMENTKQPCITLRIEATPADHDLEWYFEKIDAEGALDKVQVICEDGTVGFEVEGYTTIFSLIVRLLDTGEKSFALTISESK